MAIAYDAFSKKNSIYAVSSSTWSHTQVGTPGAVVIGVVGCKDPSGAYATSVATAIIYAGVTLTTHITLVNATLSEGGFVQVAVLATSVPSTTTATCRIMFDAAYTSLIMDAYAVTYTAPAGATLVTYVATSVSATGITATLTPSGNTVAVMLVALTGNGAPAQVAPLGGWTQRAEDDEGNFNALCHTYDTVASSDVTVGYTDSARNSEYFIAVALAELASAGLAGGIFGSNIFGSRLFGDAGVLT